MINGFADRRLCPLGYARRRIANFKLRITNVGIYYSIRIRNLKFAIDFGEDDGTRTRSFQLEGLAA